jgi:hypothetical protein
VRKENALGHHLREKIRQRCVAEMMAMIERQRLLVDKFSSSNISALPKLWKEEKKK